MRDQNYKYLKTEKEFIQILRSLQPGFTPSTEQKKNLYEILNIDYKKYFNSIDGIILNVNDFDDVKSSETFY